MYPYVSETALRHVEEKRAELGDLLRRAGPAVVLDDGVARWWTFAGGRNRPHAQVRFGIAEGWKVIADNFQLRIEGDGVGHEAVRTAAIERMASPEFWTSPTTRHAVLARLPGYRLSKFQDCLPEAMALEMVGGYLLDIEGTVRWLGGGGALWPIRVRIELQPVHEVPPRLARALTGDWTGLPDRLSVDELNVLAHMINGYRVVERHLNQEAFTPAKLRERGRWKATRPRLLAGFFFIVRGWRGLYEGPHRGDEHHREAQSLYEAVVQRLREHPEEVELVPFHGDLP